jgi:hypothetical protein
MVYGGKKKAKFELGFAIRFSFSSFRCVKIHLGLNVNKEQLWMAAKIITELSTRDDTRSEPTTTVEETGELQFTINCERK